MIYKPFNCNFPESRKKNSKIIFLFYPQTLNVICFIAKNNIFLRFCLCNFETDTVKSNFPIQIFMKMMKYLKV